MKELILIDNEPFYYESIELYHGRKRINKKVSRVNVEIFHQILSRSNVSYGLMFGTLLGAVREGDFIDHDEDVDIFVLKEYKVEFLRLLPCLKSAGLKLVRVDKDLISLMREDEYIDVYFFERKRNLSNLKRVHNSQYSIPAHFLEEISYLDFHGMKLPIPTNADQLLRTLYGKSWRIPVRGKHAEPNTLRSYIRRLYYKARKFFRENMFLRR